MSEMGMGGLSNDAEDGISSLISPRAEGRRQRRDGELSRLSRHRVGGLFVAEQRVSDEGQYWQRQSDNFSASRFSPVFSAIVYSVRSLPYTVVIVSPETFWSRRDALRVYEKAVDDNDWPYHHHCSAEAS